MSRTINNIKISNSVVEVVETNKSLVVTPNGSGALFASKTGNARGGYATDLQRIRGSNSQVASGYASTIGGGASNVTGGNYAVIGGGASNQASNGFSTVAGGTANQANGVSCFVGGGSNNTANNSYDNYGHSSVVGGFDNSANGYFCFVGGGSGNSASGAYGAYYNSEIGYLIYGHSAVVGGKDNSASAYYSFIGGGKNNSADGFHSCVVGGKDNQSSNSGSTTSGGYSNLASGLLSTVIGGKENISSGTASVSGGYKNNATAAYSTIPGGYEAKTNIFSELCHAAGKFSNVGDAQHRIVVARTQTLSGNFTITLNNPSFTKNGHGLRSGDEVKLSTTGSLPTGLNTTTTYYVIATGLTANVFRLSTSLNGSAITPTGSQSGTHSLLVTSSTLFVDNTLQRLSIPAETTWTFTINLSAHNDTNNDGGWWIIRGGIRRNGSNTTTLIGNVITEYGTESNLSTATVSVEANDEAESLDIKAGGVAAKNIRWVAIIDISQVSYGTP